MGIKNIFGRGDSYYGQNSSRLNLPSDEIDRRKKENASYRTSRAIEGKLVEKSGVFYMKTSDGELKKLTCQEALQ